MKFFGTPLPRLPRRRAFGLACVPAALVVVGSLIAGLPVGAGATSKTSASKTSASKTNVRTIDVEMFANSFKPNVVRVAANETIQFRFINNTVAPHEALIGDMDDQIKHAKEMQALAKDGVDHGDHMDHGDGPIKGYVLVKAKSTKTLSYRFAKPGRLLIGCHQPGHWEGGMKLALVVQPKSVI